MSSIENITKNFKTRTQQGKSEIWDNLRKKWIRLTPEEWVRQHFLQYIVEVKKYPTTLIAIEKEIKLYDVKKRFDIVIYDKNTKPWMIVECKGEKELLNDAVIQQVLRYNLVIKATYVVITNGAKVITFQHNSQELEILNELPNFPKI